MDELGINLAGVQRLLSIADIVERMRPLTRETSGADDSRRAWSASSNACAECWACNVARSTTRRLWNSRTTTRRSACAKTATDKDIKQAYRKLARKFHPDVNPGDKKSEARFKDINEAYEVLGDPEKRKKYDELGANWRMYEQAQQAGQPPGGGPAAMDRERWRPGRRFPDDRRGRDAEDLRRRGSLLGLLQDVLRRRRGESRPRAHAAARAQRIRAGHDLEHEIDLSLEDALRGTTRRLSLQHDGQTRTVDVRIPAGVGDGSRVRVAGEGEAGIGGGHRPATSTCACSMRPHPQFERRGRDLHTRVAVPVTTAVLGGEADVPTLGGGRLRLKIPARRRRTARSSG